ncbi:MAG: tRNA (adenosine(37)-N6)-threonylcarbamoyltransferase complex dimerization subunit type 1 TsaB [Chlorobi bacterium]|nr:tRNA (adenosine(37)-N6)-threonylcarbamoyltransferase complex dimerization subunit type 1 TsaB [Chlorobiota bacterium]
MHSTVADNIPRLLALETSGAACSIALLAGEQLLAEYALEEPNVHDRMLAVSVERILDDTHTQPEMLDALAVSAGPGSFTGLRIGLAFAKGFCFGTATQLIMVPTLEACASSAVPIAKHIPECDIAAIVHAHDDLYFAQHFACDGTPLTEPAVLEHNIIEQRITMQTIVCGSGAREFRHGIHIPGLARLTARFVARRALALLAAAEISDPANAAPLYVEEFAPKRRLTAQSVD